MKMNSNALITLFLLFLINTSYAYTAQDTVLFMPFENDLSYSGKMKGVALLSNGVADYQYGIDKMNKSIYIHNAPNDQGQCIIIPKSNFLNLKSNWRVELWADVRHFGSDKAAFPTLFLLDGDGFPAIAIGFDHFGNGFNATITLHDQHEIGFQQNQTLTYAGWHHLKLVSDSLSREVTFTVSDSLKKALFSHSIPFPKNHSGKLYFADKQLLLGGVSGSSNIQFDGKMDQLLISKSTGETPINVPPLQFTEQPFAYYSQSENAAYWETLRPDLFTELNELLSYWQRPLIEPLFAHEDTIKIYALHTEDFNKMVPETLPTYQNCKADLQKSIIYLNLGKINSGITSNIKSAAIAGLAQLVVNRELIRRSFSSIPEYFLTGFALYRAGHRPSREGIQQAYSSLGGFPTIAHIQDTSGIYNTYKRDLTLSYIEFQLFTGISYQNISTYGYEKLWHAYLDNYFLKEENLCIKLAKSTAHFNLYAADQDSTFLDSISAKLEEKLAYYQNTFQRTINNRFNVVIFPDEATGMACMGYNDFYNGGSGVGGDKLDILSPIYFGGGMEEALKSLIPHEFFHVYHNHLVKEMGLIYGFHAEGMAEYLTYGQETEQYLNNRTNYIKNALENFKSKQGHYPTLQNFIDDNDGTLNVYLFGQAFWYYMHKNHCSYIQMRSFFEEGLNWGVFNTSFAAIDSGYTQYIYDLAGITAIEEDGKKPIKSYYLYQNYPNPFNPTTTIEYHLSQQGHVTLTVYNILGQKVQTLINKMQPAGHHTLKFNATHLNSGTYYYTISAGHFCQTIKMNLIK